LVGYLFDAGKGLKRNPAKAVKWFEYCAKENPKASYNLAVIYAEGRGVDKDLSKAESYFIFAWDKLKIIQAGIRLAYFYRAKEDWKNEWEWVQHLKEMEKYPRHWGFLMGEMILKERAPIHDQSKAIEVLNLAISDKSQMAAELLSEYYENQDSDMENKLTACRYDIVAATFAGHKKWAEGEFVTKWQSVLNHDNILKCNADAMELASSLINHEQLDFKKLLY
jgi:TPR repeat protein